MSLNKEGVQSVITHFLRPASHDVVVHLGQERILPCPLSDLSTGDRQFVHTSEVEPKVSSLSSLSLSLSLSLRFAGSSYGSRESASACDSSDPGRYAMSYEYPDKMSARVIFFRCTHKVRDNLRSIFN